MKTIDSLDIQDLQAFPVWRYRGSDAEGQILVRPVKTLPVSDLKNKIVGTQVSLANELKVWAVVGNVDSNSPTLTRHFLALSVFHEGRWFGLARYHDFDYVDRGPAALAKLLHLNLNEIFPIAYDLSPYVKGNPASLVGTIVSDPEEKLSKSQLMNLVIAHLHA